MCSRRGFARGGGGRFAASSNSSSDLHGSCCEWCKRGHNGVCDVKHLLLARGAPVSEVERNFDFDRFEVGCACPISRLVLRAMD